MTNQTLVRRQEQHRDRWSAFGSGDGMLRLSEKLSAKELQQYDIFGEYPPDFLEEISPDVTVASWRQDAVLFEQGSYLDLAFYVLEGEVRVSLTTPATDGAESAPIFGGARDTHVVGGATDAGGTGKATVYFERSESARSVDEAMLATMDFDMPSTGQVMTLGRGEFFGEIGALNGWPQSVTAQTVADCLLVQIRVPALRLMKRRSRAFKKRLEAVYRSRALLPQLRACPLFRDCPEALLGQVAERSELISCNPGAAAISEGDTLDSLYLVRSGFMKLSQRMGEGQLAVAYLSKGMSFGETELLVEGQSQSRCTVTSVGYGELVRIDGGELRTLIQAQPAVEHRLWEQVVERIKHVGANRARPHQSELIQFSLDKGLVEGNSILVIDLSVCTRCDDCVRACEDTHGGRPRFVREGDRYDNLLIAKSCYHCQDPVCLVGCPTGAIRRANVGDVVEIKEHICIGCENCADKCPYDAIIMQPTGDTWPADSLPERLRGTPRSVASKCDHCHGSPKGPACVRGCPHHCAVRVGSIDEFQQLAQKASR